MDWEALAKNFGMPGLMLGAMIYGWRLWVASNEKVQLAKVQVEDKKAEAMAAALMSLSGKIDAHHTVDIQSHQSLATGIARIDSKLDTIHEFAPVNQPRAATPPRGVQANEHGFSRPKTGGR